MSEESIVRFRVAMGAGGIWCDLLRFGAEWKVAMLSKVPRNVEKFSRVGACRLWTKPHFFLDGIPTGSNWRLEGIPGQSFCLRLGQEKQQDNIDASKMKEKVLPRIKSVIFPRDESKTGTSRIKMPLA